MLNANKHSPSNIVRNKSRTESADGSGNYEDSVHHSVEKIGIDF